MIAGVISVLRALIALVGMFQWAKKEIALDQKKNALEEAQKNAEATKDTSKIDDLLAK